jgi:hypothetical protein
MIPPTGISARLKDRRVDRVLAKQGYEAEQCEIFYSPITAWITYLAILLTIPLPFAIDYFSFLYRNFTYFCLYLLVGYLMGAYLNNSIVLTKNELVIVNPNFPFRHSVIYKLEEISYLKIDQSKWLWPAFVFAHGGGNYVEISTGDTTRRFYCTCLQLDAYDENLTEKTMDDLRFALRERNVPHEFNLP